MLFLAAEGGHTSLRIRSKFLPCEQMARWNERCSSAVQSPDEAAAAAAAAAAAGVPSVPDNQLKLPLQNHWICVRPSPPYTTPMFG